MDSEQISELGIALFGARWLEMNEAAVHSLGGLANVTNRPLIQAAILSVALTCKTNQGAWRITLSKRSPLDQVKKLKGIIRERMAETKLP